MVQSLKKIRAARLSVVTATLLTLIVIPVLFMLFERVVPTRSDREDTLLAQIDDLAARQ